MIARLTGKLVESDLTEAVIDVNGIGFSVSIPMSTFEKLPTVGGAVSLYTVLQVREDNMQLFGFATKEERTLFNLLTATVSGIGPKLALNVLSCISIDGFIRAVSESDVKALSKINGIGKRTAERMVLELKDKLNVFAGASMPAVAASTGAKSQAALDAAAALETLGYKRDAAEKAVQAIAAENPSFTAEELIRRALAALNS
jgi:Holliday junction DNA helicase RuvA